MPDFLSCTSLLLCLTHISRFARKRLRLIDCSKEYAVCRGKALSVCAVNIEYMQDCFIPYCVLDYRCKFVV